ncbi:MAG: ABC transporter ATP-binding protein [Lautropia sp.]
MPAIEIEALRFGWRPRDPPCLDIAQLSIEGGERVFMHGASGSGKSTLLGLIAGVMTPQSGVVRLLGASIGQQSARWRDRFRVDHVGLIFQQFNLVPYLSAEENVLLPCCFSTRRRSRASCTALELLDRVGLAGPLLRRPVTELSVGQQQRVAAARALIGRPELLIADEPTSALDADRQRDFLALLLDQAKANGSTLVFVSHDRRLATLFDRELSLASINRAYRAMPDVADVPGHPAVPEGPDVPGVPGVDQGKAAAARGEAAWRR